MVMVSLMLQSSVHFVVQAKWRLNLKVHALPDVVVHLLDELSEPHSGCAMATAS